MSNQKLRWLRDRPGVSSEQAFSAATWIAQGLYDKYASALPEQVDGYFELIKRSIYDSGAVET